MSENFKFKHIRRKLLLAKKRYTYETDSRRRRRIRTSLNRKMQNLIEECLARVGQEACVVTFDAQENFLGVYGAEPLRQVLEVMVPSIKEELYRFDPDDMYRRQNTNQILPELIINAEHRSIDEFTLANLRMFIPLMLKYATGRGKPGWGRPELKPSWWPNIAPWANVRIDMRTEEEKSTMPWKYVLQEIVKSCYCFHNQEDFLYPPIVSEPEIIMNVENTSDEVKGVHNSDTIIEDTALTSDMETSVEEVIEAEDVSISSTTEFAGPIFQVSTLDQTDNIATFDLTNIMQYCNANGIIDIMLQTDFGDMTLHLQPDLNHAYNNIIN